MSEFSSALSIAASGMRSQTVRLSHVSENIANADTPGYRRKTVSFEATHAGTGTAGAVTVSRVHLDQSVPQRIYYPGHPLADETGHYQGSTVDLMIEIADAREAQRSYEANLKMFDQVRQMSAGLMDLLRR